MLSSSVADHSEFGSPITGTNETPPRTDQSSNVSFLQTPSTTPSFYKARNLRDNSSKDFIHSIDLTTPSFSNSKSSGKNMSTYIDLCSPSIPPNNMNSSALARRPNRKLLISSPTDYSLSENSLNDEIFVLNKLPQNDENYFDEIHDIDGTNEEEENREDDDEEERQKREEAEAEAEAEAESEALARQLMAEEAMASYAMSTNFLRDHANDYTEEDLAALQAIMAEENPEVNENEEEYVEEAPSEDLSYDTLLRLGERMGDVKSERWALIAREIIEKLPKKNFTKAMPTSKDENDCGVKCLICQCAFEESETVRILPCKHYFHEECVDQWLLTKDSCPYCRVSIVDENNEIRN